MEQPKKTRYEIIDMARGISILLMVIHHFAYDLVAFSNVPAVLLDNVIVESLHFIFASLFIFMSGASSTFSHGNVKRGLIILLGALAVTMATYFFLPEYIITFGILHFLGFAALLFALLEPLFKKYGINPWICLILFVIAYVVTRGVYEVDYLWALGFRSASLKTADYFPVLPWIFMYFLGSWFGYRVTARRLPEWFYTVKPSFFSRIGRKTLWIYLLHQPVLMGLTLLINHILGIE